jgi:hypothetical protein
MPSLPASGSALQTSTFSIQYSTLSSSFLLWVSEPLWSSFRSLAAREAAGIERTLAYVA